MAAMGMPLVVGVDGSASSLRALDWAADEAERLRLPLRIVHASLWERYEVAEPSAHGVAIPSAQVPDETLPSSAVARVRRRVPDLEVHAEEMAEDPETALLEQARNASALITGSRGRGPIAELLLGSVSLAVAARAHCPVIVVRGGEDNFKARHHRIVLGIGDSATTGAATLFAIREAQSRGCLLEAVRAWRCPANESVDDPLLAAGSAHEHRERATELIADALRDPVAGHPGVEVVPAACEGPAHKVLRDRSATADLLVLGARRRHGHLGLQLSRVSHTLLHHAGCPVAIVPQHG
ncbi:nucleotide-binding universal stress UspA family protein [Streptomyces sp. TLI_146]|nr:nucleotide-binding universal stress UspA family protein [Streptomyces sp. TLI_146]